MNIEKKHKIILLIIIGIFIFGFFLVPKLAKNSMLEDIKKEKIDEKIVTKVEYVKYEGDALMSVTEEKKEVIGEKSKASMLIHSIDSYKTNALFSKNSSNEILLYTFKDGTSLICYIDNDNLGIDNGKVWVKGVNIEEIKGEMKNVTLVKTVK